MPLGASPLLERLGHRDGHTDPGSQELGARGPPRVSAPPVSAVQRTTGPSGERGYAMLGPCAQRQRYATACCAYRPWLGAHVPAGAADGVERRDDAEGRACACAIAAGGMVLVAFMLGPCAQRQRYPTACCAYRPTFIRCLSITPPRLRPKMTMLRFSTEIFNLLAHQSWWANRLKISLNVAHVCMYGASSLICMPYMPCVPVCMSDVHDCTALRLSRQQAPRRLYVCRICLICLIGTSREGSTNVRVFGNSSAAMQCVMNTIHKRKRGRAQAR